MLSKSSTKAIALAIVERQEVMFSYRKEGEKYPYYRYIVPNKLDTKSVGGIDTVASGVRQFRLDRIEGEVYLRN